MKKILTIVGAAAVSFAVLTPPAQASPNPYAIQISGDPSISASHYGLPGTTIVIPLTVRCPKGERQMIPFAGLPNSFGGKFPRPFLPSMTIPVYVDCTGKNQASHTYARSIARNQDTQNYPYEIFTPGRATVIVHLGIMGEPMAIDVERVKIRP